MAEQVDVVVIGGGIAGASVAYFLGLAGVRNVLVLERSAVAAGASGLASGLLTFLTGSHPVQAAVLKASAEFYAQWPDRVGGPPVLEQLGALLLMREAQRSILSVEVQRMQQAGHDTVLLTRDEIAQLVPEWRLDDVDLAAYSPGSGAIDPPAVTTALMNSARTLGARVYHGAEVSGFNISGGRIRGVTCTRGTIVSPIVVIAAGAWSAQLGRLAGVSIEVVPQRHQVAHLTLPAGVIHPLPLCTDPYLNVYLRPERGGLVTVGQARHEPGLPPEPPCVPDDFDAGAAAWLGPWVRDRLVRRIPLMADAQVAGGHAGVYAVSPDNYPLLGPFKEVEGLYLLCDTAGNGMTSSPGLARAIVDIILHGTTYADVSLYSPDRFSRGAAILPPYHHAGADLTQTLEASGVDDTIAASLP